MHVQSRRWSLGLVPPLLLALGLRWFGLHNQILTDDELHAVHGALAMPVRDIIQTWTFGGADYGVPQAAFYRLLMDQGFVFSELSFRIPSLLAGLVAVFVLPCLTVNRIGERAAVVLAWLLAISPMLTLYSRIVRPICRNAAGNDCRSAFFPLVDDPVHCVRNRIRLMRSIGCVFSSSRCTARTCAPGLRRGGWFYA